MSDKRIQLSAGVFLAFPQPGTAYLEVERKGHLVYSEVLRNIEKAARIHDVRFYPLCLGSGCENGTIDLGIHGWAECVDCEGSGRVLPKKDS